MARRKRRFRKHTTRKQPPAPSRRLLVGIIISVMALVVLAMLFRSEPADPPTNNAVIQETNQFARDTFMPTWVYLAKEHPLPEIRQGVSELQTDMDMGKLKLVFHPFPPTAHQGGLSMLAAINNDPHYVTVPKLEIFVANVENQYRRNNRERFTDILAVTILHERYHYLHHDWTRNSPEEGESEAYWYQASIVEQLRAIGRLELTTGMDLFRTSWEIRRVCSRPEDKAWQTFMRVLFNKEEKKALCRWIDCRAIIRNIEPR